jgi:hypothetical protein
MRTLPNYADAPPPKDGTLASKVMAMEREWTAHLLAVANQMGCNPKIFLKSSMGDKQLAKARAVLIESWSVSAGNDLLCEEFLCARLSLPSRTYSRMRERVATEPELALAAGRALQAKEVILRRLTRDHVLASIRGRWTGVGNPLRESHREHHDLLLESRRWLQEAGLVE